MEEDAQLLRRYVEERSDAAFAELLRRHLDLVYSVALRRVGSDTHLAQDVAQNVFTDLARKAGSLAKCPSLAGWLYVAANYAAAVVVRTERRRKVREQEAQTMHELLSENSASGAVPDWDLLRPVLDEAMLELDAQDREAVLLRFFQGRTFQNVGSALRLTEDAARKRVGRALDKLHGLLARRGVTSTSAALVMALSEQAVVAAPCELAAAIGAEVSAGAAGTVATTGILLMAKIKTGLVVALLALLGIGLLVQQQTKTRLKTQNLDLDARRQTLMTATADVRRLAAQWRRDLDTFAGIAVSSPDSAVIAPVPAPVSRSLARSGIDKDYAPLFRHLQLGREKLGTLVDLLVEREASRLEMERFAARITGHGISEWATRAEQEEFIATGTTEIDGRIRALLSDGSYAYFVSYRQNRPWREPYDQLAAQLVTRAPLSDEQIDQLASWSAQANPNLYSRRAQGASLVPEAILARAEGILSPLQFKRLLELKEGLDAWQRMNLWIARAREKEMNPSAASNAVAPRLNSEKRGVPQ